MIAKMTFHTKLALTYICGSFFKLLFCRIVHYAVGLAR